MSFIEDAGTKMGMTGAAALPGAIMGIGLGMYNDNRQEIQNRKLQRQQLDAQQEMSRYNYDMQMKMWDATNYSAQMGQLKKAGLNPALIYGMGGGAGGQIGAEPGHADTAKAEQNPGDVQAMTGMGIQAGMMQAQIDLMKAQARNLDADTENKPKTGQNIEASTGLLKAQTGNTDADTILKGVNTKIQSIQAEIQGATIEDQIRIINGTANKISEEVDQAIVKTAIDRATQQTLIDTARANLIATYLKNNLTKAETQYTQAGTAERKSNIQVNDQEIQNLSAEILQKWVGLGNQANWNAIQKNYTEKLIDLGVGEEVIQGVGTILGAMGKGGALQQVPQRNPIQGFHNR